MAKRQPVAHTGAVRPDAFYFIRAIPDANSGANKPLSAASTASFLTAVIRTLI
jgi:hypothetical protein